MSEPLHAHRPLNRSGCVAAGVWRGEAAVLKMLPALTPWTDPMSPFYGTVGLVPPFRPAIEHEAMAYRLLQSEMLLETGFGPDGAWLLLRDIGPTVSHSAAPDLAVRLLERVARCRRVGIVHNDIRPANLLDSDAGCMLIDFDISCIQGVGPLGRLGTRPYAAPELVAGSCSVRSDLFSLGRTLRHLVPDPRCPPEPRQTLDHLRLVSCEDLGQLL